jgi:hypothetical protein
MIQKGYFVIFFFKKNTTKIEIKFYLRNQINNVLKIYKKRLNHFQ